MTTYKTTDPGVLDATSKYFKDLEIMHAGASAFSKQFGAEKMICYSSCFDSYFGGLVFNPPKDNRFWTNPHRKDGTQYPRKKVSRLNKEEKEVHAKLLESWNQNFPKFRVSKDEVYKSLGTHRGNVFLAGLAFFMHENAVYVETNVSLASHVVEILYSEYYAAKKAFQEAQA